jgi:4-amino-4-deoxy-L-arabinose transferase-like glycosyltransferase
MRSWEPFAWSAITLTAAFIAITYWWLTQDRGVPGTEPGAALYAALRHRDMLHAGDLLGPLRFDAIHPPLLQIVGAVGMLVGGVNVTAPVLAENLVFVPLLALGCYQTGKLVAGSRAGLLAVVFALGTPLMIEQLHVFMVDAPDAALVAVSVWLILASERFERLGVAALAGVAVGLGLETKQQFPFFVAGLLVVVLLRGQGWRNWRGIAIFAAAALAVGSPWYLIHLDQVSGLTRDAVAAAQPGTLPPRLSTANLAWYGWGALNGLLYAPLFVIAAIGMLREAWDVVRRRVHERPRGAPAEPRRRDVRPELLAGAAVSWLALLATPIHVVRYMLPMTIYFAVLGTAWIARLAMPWRRVAAGGLGFAVVATTLGATFGVGDRVRVMLTSAPVPDRSVYGIHQPDQIVLYAPRSFMVSGPNRSGDVLGLLRALRLNGIVAVTWMPETEEPLYFDPYGLDTLATMAGLNTLSRFNPEALAPHVAVLLRRPAFGTEPPCLRLEDGTGLWVRLGRVLWPADPNYCPLRRPAFYPVQ